MHEPTFLHALTVNALTSDLPTLYTLTSLTYAGYLIPRRHRPSRRPKASPPSPLSLLHRAPSLDLPPVSPTLGTNQPLPAVLLRRELPDPRQVRGPPTAGPAQSPAAPTGAAESQPGRTTPANASRERESAGGAGGEGSRSSGLKAHVDACQVAMVHAAAWPWGRGGV